MILILLAKQIVDITGILINLSRSSFISYKISIKVVNWVKKLQLLIYLNHMFFRDFSNDQSIVLTTYQSLNAAKNIINSLTSLTQLIL